MSVVKEPTIKLFGKTILLPSAAAATTSEDCSDCHLVSSPIPLPKHNSGKEPEGDEETSGKVLNQEDDSTHEITEPTTSSTETPSPKAYSNEEQNDTRSISQEKTLKKPDKILPCPRCNSNDTKFCYYNNYNVNQPRYFCKNCQRYWTAGGTMRRVPVGAGRRKNKISLASQYRHVMVQEGSNGLSQSKLGSKGTLLTFGPDSTPNCFISSVSNDFLHFTEQKILVCSRGAENGDDHSCKSSITVSTSSENGNTAQWIPSRPSLSFCHPSFPVSFYHVPPYWGCSCTSPSSWNVQCLSPPSISGSDSRALGKHHRDGDILDSSNNSERCLWMPKTLRIDDPNEAANSSILSTLGSKNEKITSFNGGGLFKSFQSKEVEENRIKTLPVLLANPAALSRSFQFQESAKL